MTCFVILNVDYNVDCKINLPFQFCKLFNFWVIHILGSCSSLLFFPLFKYSLSYPDQDSDSDSDLSLDEERSLSIPSSESEENVHLRGRFQRPFKRAAHSERLLTNPSNNAHKGKSQDSEKMLSHEELGVGGSRAQDGQRLG